MLDQEVRPFQWAEDYIAEIDDYDRWLIEPLIPTEGIVNFYGKPKAGKSFAAIGAAIAVASGKPDWNGFKIHQHGNVAYFQVDTPRGEWKNRFRNIKLAGYDLKGIGIIDMKMAPYPYNVLLPQHQAYLRQQLEEIKPVMLVVDTLREVHETNENDSTDMKRVISAIVKLARPRELDSRPAAALVFVSHSRKDSAFNSMGAESDLMDEGRGSSYVSGRMDTVVKFTGGRKPKGGGPAKGHMTYKGRSVEETKIPIVQEEGTGLVILEASHARQEHATIAMLRENGAGWTKNKMATELVNAGVFTTVKTATRWLDKLKPHAQLVSENPSLPVVEQN